MACHWNVFTTVLMDNPMEFHVEDRAESHVKNMYMTNDISCIFPFAMTCHVSAS